MLQLGWEEETIKSILTAEGGVVHGLVGVGEEDWLWLEPELDAIAGPLSRILNRYPVTAAAAGMGDAAAVLIALGGHGTRSMLERRAVLEARVAAPEPVSGVRAPAGTGPDHDPRPKPLDEEEPQWTTASN